MCSNYIGALNFLTSNQEIEHLKLDFGVTSNKPNKFNLEPFY